MIFNVGAGGGGAADQIKYDNGNSGLEATNVQGVVDELNTRLVNENNETFNYGVKDGVRGFFTDPSRADDSFIPFRSGAEIVFYFSGIADGNNKPNKNQSSEMSFTITEKGKYTIICMTNGYRNAGYDVYKNTEKICTVNLSRDDGKTLISNKEYSFECNTGDVISISNIQAVVSLMQISALLIK